MPPIITTIIKTMAMVNTVEPPIIAPLAPSQA